MGNGVAFFIRTKEKSGFTTLFVRVQNLGQKINHRLATPFEVDVREWNAAKRGKTAWQNFLRNHMELTEKLARIKKELEATETRPKPVTKEEVRKIVNEVYYAEQLHRQRIRTVANAMSEAGKDRMNLRKFITKFRRDIASGARLTERNTVYAKGTVYAISQACERLRKYERHIHHILDFNEIDLKFYADYTSYLNSLGYSINTTGKCIKVIKQIMALSEAEGYHNNSKYKDRRFKGTRIDVDSIYLTREELDRIDAVDLSGMPEDFAIARDIFMVGVWTAQRISDYNNIHRDEIQSVPMRQIIEDPDPEHPGKTITKVLDKEVKVINITQQKTGTKVSVPCSPSLLKILEKYNDDIPRLPDQLINDNIKEIARLAGIIEPVCVTVTKGGRHVKEMVPKYKLVLSHTARRTGATLMYLSGMDIYDIMKITGHTTPVMLKKYIKADTLEVVHKIMTKYNYFK